MTPAVDGGVSTEEPVTGARPTRRRPWQGDRARGVGVAAAVCVVVGLLAGLPLTRDKIFYSANGDTATQFMPMWYHLGTQIRSGHWPVLLNVHSWMGGNVAAEALFGVFNPVNTLTQVGVSLLPNLALAATLLKAGFLAWLALGVYLVAREYRAPRWAAAPVAVALPFAGFTLYFEAGMWLSGLIAFAWLPHVWWSVHRTGRGRLNPLWAFLIGALAVTVGNPYGVLGVVVVLAGLLVQFAVERNWAGLRRVLLVGVCIGLVVPLVFLPLIGTSSVSWRTDHSIIYDGDFAPRAGDLLNLSSPTFLPFIRVFGSRAGTFEPVVYLAWFITPLLPWLDWRALRGRLRMLTGPLVVTGVLLALALGPSHLWMFRWPIRLVELTYLGVAVLFAAALSGGLRRDRWAGRAGGSALILFAGAYLSWGTRPDLIGREAVAFVLLAALTAAAVVVGRRSRRGLALVLSGGTALTLLLQVLYFPVNANVTRFDFPHQVARLQSRFADYHGTTFALMSRATVRNGEEPGRYRNFLFGNEWLVADVDAVNSYTGLGFEAFSHYFCMQFLSNVCPRAYARLWAPTDLGGQSMADLMRLETVVVDRSLRDRPTSPRPGWHVQRSTRLAVVLQRDGAPSPWPDGRLSYAAPGVDVLADHATHHDRSETVRFRSDGAPATLAFARLNWPGYTARLGNRELPVTDGPAGLLTVRLPAGVQQGTVHLDWTPPGYHVGIAAALLGVLGALALGALSVLQGWRRRRRRPEEPDPSPAAEGSTA